MRASNRLLENSEGSRRALQLSHNLASDLCQIILHDNGTGVVGIRVQAGGALSGSTERHAIASPTPETLMWPAPLIALGKEWVCHKLD